MKRALTAVLFVILTLPDGGLAAPDLSDLYPQTELAERQSRYGPNLQWNFENLVLGSLTPDERARLGQVRLATPLQAEGQMRGHPLAFYAGGHTVTMPILSVKFFDDLTLAWAFFWAKELSLEPVTDYLGMLKYRDPREIGGRFAPPLEALGVPPDIWKSDKVIDDVSQKALKSALVWVMAHELGHIYFRHQGYAGVSPVQARHNEAEADRFANTIMRRIGESPSGMAQFFMMMVHFDPNQTDFADVAAWEAYQAEEATHPLTAARLNAIADDLERDPQEFAASDSDIRAGTERVVYVAQQMRAIGGFLADPEVLRSIKLKALATDPASLQRWNTAAAGAGTETPFAGRYRGSYIRRIGGGSEALDANLELNRQGDFVTGRFWFGLGEGQIVGLVQGGKLNYEWTWGDTFGTGQLVAGPAGGLSGAWGYADSSDDGGAWDVKPQ